jgi:Xaa-Pro aminopeptidase
MRRFRASLPLRLAFVVIALAVPAVAQQFQDDLKARRARVMERLGPDSILILFSASEKVYSQDVNYEFRQDSNLYYLTGVDQPDTILVLMPGNQERKEILFVKSPDPVQEHWTGHVLTKQEATAESGIVTVNNSEQFEQFLSAILSGRSFDAAAGEYDTFFKALRDSRARVQLVLGPPPKLNEPLPETLQFANKLKDRYNGFVITDAGAIFRDQRQIKTAYEQKILQDSADISSEAHMAGMKAARPGGWEYEVEAAIEYVYKKRGAFDWGYPSIVGSGPNATTLHYEKSSRQMQDGDLLLVDAAGFYKYVTVDITRTYPVNGKFTQTQKDIYNIVLQAQEEGMKVAKAGNKLGDVNAKTVEVIKQGLFKLGLISDTSGDQYRIWYTHGATHFIGIDVHDVGDNQKPLAPGMAFTIEPGIYIRESALDNLPKTAQNLEFIAKVRPMVQKYKDIGVRIEDSFLLTNAGLSRLSAKVPRTIEEIESFMKTR